MLFDEVDKSKTNLKIKQRKRKNNAKAKILDQRKNKEKNNLQNIDLIFGLDNGASRNYCKFSSEKKKN